MVSISTFSFVVLGVERYSDADNGSRTGSRVATVPISVLESKDRNSQRRRDKCQFSNLEDYRLEANPQTNSSAHIWMRKP